MWRSALFTTLAALLALTPLLAQETEANGPPPILWAVPHLQLENGQGANLFRRA